MTALETDDFAVVTGPLSLFGHIRLSDGYPTVFLEPGEVVRVIDSEDADGAVYVWGLSTEMYQSIDASSLTPLSEIQDDPDIEWGAEDEQYVRLSSTHDYVYEGDDE